MSDTLATARLNWHQARDKHLGAEALHKALVDAGVLNSEAYNASRAHICTAYATRKAAWKSYMAAVEAQKQLKRAQQNEAIAYQLEAVES